MSAHLSYRLAALLLSFMLLLSSTAWSVDLHYCQGKLQTFNLFGEAKSCHEKAKKVKSSHCKKKLKSCHKKLGDNSEHSEKDCCDNQKFSLESLDVQFAKSVHSDLTKIQIQFLFSFTNSFFNFNQEYSTPTEYLNYKPPLPQKNLQVLYATFLI